MILAKLKESTRAQHEGVENTVDIMSQMFTLENYKTLLSKFYRFYAGLEAELEKFDWSETGYDFEARRKLPKLVKDLENLGITANENLSKWDELPDIDTYAKAFGSIYVIEGATLGGQIIKRHLKEHLGLTPENGGMFFNGYGERTGPMWKEFGQIITAFSADGSDDELIIESAKATFDSINKCFTQSLD